MSYELFNPARRLEEFAARLPKEYLDEAAAARLTKRPCKYVIKGEWVYADGRSELDIAINYAWVTTKGHVLEDGFLRYECHDCGRLSGNHAKGCTNR